MQKKNPRKRCAQRRNAWVYIASGLLTMFTVFVLLDTFAIGRVMQEAQAADYSSIVNAQEQQSGKESGGSADSSQSRSGSDAASTDDADDAGSSSNAQSSDAVEAAGESGASSELDDASSESSSASAHSGHGPGKPTGRRGSDGASDYARKHGKAGTGTSTSKSSGSSSSASSAAELVAGAATASTGTQIGTYSDDNMQITVSQVRAYDTDIYIADVQVSSAEYLKTALAQNSYGRNLKDTTSNMAEEAGAVLAINGDYYGFRDEGYVLRNGVLYRDTAASGTDALVVYGDGAMAAASQDETTAQELKDSGAWQLLSFGPVLVQDGQLAVDADDEVSQSRNSNPRTAIGMVDPLHYVVVVSDGRTDSSAGLSLYQLAQVLVDNGATFAYNLDGGGSTAMYFQGEIINNPTSGNLGGEREVSDIVYFG